jgi:glycopeptide antibiotics resistance protein
LNTTNFNPRWRWWLLVAVTSVWLLWLTLNPGRRFPPSQFNYIPLADHSRAMVCVLDSSCQFQRQAFWFLAINLVGNILVFIPLGVGLAGALDRGRPGQTILAAVLGGFALSLSIELVQLALPTRATDVDDLIFNTLGAAIGAMAFVWLRQYHRHVQEF